MLNRPNISVGQLGIVYVLQDPASKDLSLELTEHTCENAYETKAITLFNNKQTEKNKSVMSIGYLEDSIEMYCVKWKTICNVCQKTWLNYLDSRIPFFVKNKDISHRKNMEECTSKC